LPGLLIPVGERLELRDGLPKDSACIFRQRLPGCVYHARRQKDACEAQQ
jgi:hypothetical protein